MTDIQLSKDIFSDLRILFKNANNYFKTKSLLPFDANYCLLNTMWKEMDLNYVEREGLSTAIGNFYSCDNKINFLRNSYTVLFTGWSDMFEYYLLHKDQNENYKLNQMEPHYIASILTFRSIAIELNLNNNQFWQVFYNGMNPFLSQWEEIDDMIGGKIVSRGLVNRFNNLFTFDWYINHLNNSVYEMDYDKRKYFQEIISNQKEIYMDFNKSYIKIFKVFSQQINTGA